VDELPPRYKLMALLAAWCAMRFGELAELRRSDIDLDTSRVKIRRAVVRADCEFIVGLPKSDAGIRDVAIPPHLVPFVEGHLADFTGPGKHALLFPAAADGNLHMAPSTLYKVYYPARVTAGRRDLRWHDLRHTGAVLAAQTGATLAELMGRLGHTTPGAAMRYQHAAADRDAEIARRLSALVEPGASHDRVRAPAWDGPRAYAESMSESRVVADHRIMGGVPCLRGTRIPVATVIGLVAQGQSFEDIIADYPQLSVDDVRAALEFGAAAVSQRQDPRPTSA
jgi:uncharacterized protein (DUF433 family)